VIENYFYNNIKHEQHIKSLIVAKKKFALILEDGQFIYLSTQSFFIVSARTRREYFR